MRTYLPVLLISTLFIYSCNNTINLSTEVLVIGGGVSGTSAAIQAARDGAQVILVESTPWLGGMLTSAGVSATDGNHRLSSGLWGEFRQQLYDHYGGPDAVSTGWVSFTLFEPHVGREIWESMADKLPSLKRYYEYELVDVLKEDGRVNGAVFRNEKGKKLKVTAQITIEATELGDALELAGATYFTGIDTPENPHDTNVQDLTYAAILKDFGEGADMTIGKPANYRPDLYNCFCDTVCDADTVAMNCDQVLDYAELPGGKYMINWPHNGNDYYVDATKLTQKEREKAYQNAKNVTLGLIYFIQTEAGYKHLGLAIDEYPTQDKLPFIPYHREARRVNGMVRLTVEDLVDPYANVSRPLYRDAIAVGDYPLDHHHKRNSNPPEETFPPIPSFSIPYGSLVPEEIDGLLVAEKSISVSHIVNGATRLQPVVILIGQAAGAAAAMCIKERIEPRAVQVRILQQHLLDAGCWLMPFLDITPQDRYFQAVQRVGTAGWMKGEGIPFQWANQTWFYPDSCVTIEILLDALEKASLASNLERPSFLNTQSCTTVGEAIRTFDLVRRGQKIFQSGGELNIIPQQQFDREMEEALNIFDEKGWITPLKENGALDMDRSLLRKELAWLLDVIYQPYQLKNFTQ